MSKIEIGELYLVKERFWFLFPTKEMAVGSEMVGLAHAVVAYRYAKWYSESLQCNVDVVEENTYVVFLEHDNAYFKLLDSNGKIGWIWCRDFSKCFELVKE